MIITPTLKLAERNEDELAARNELDDRLDATLEGVEAHAKAGSSLFATEEQAWNRLERAPG